MRKLVHSSVLTHAKAIVSTIYTMCLILAFLGTNGRSTCAHMDRHCTFPQQGPKTLMYGVRLALIRWCWRLVASAH